MFVAWGKERGVLYNDAYAEILGAKAMILFWFNQLVTVCGNIVPLFAYRQAGCPAPIAC